MDQETTVGSLIAVSVARTGGAFMSDGMAGVADAACLEGTIYTVSEVQPIHHHAAVIYRRDR